MKTIKTAFFILFLILISPSAISQNWNLVWQDEFTNGISHDWVFETGNNSGWGNKELQYYRQENANVENGKLVITAKREDFGGQQYTSARMKTQGRKKFKYGKIEARIAMPTGQGLWPAFWMLSSNITTLGWPACGEIDIMEHVNSDPEIHGTIHWKDGQGNYASHTGHTAVTPNNYHIYSVEWDKNSIKWFVDGHQYNEVDISNGINGTSEFHDEYFVLFNLAVGGKWPGFVVDNNKLPARMYVDYVRVYQDNTDNLPTRIEAENYTAMKGVQVENTADHGGGQNVGWIDTDDWMSYHNISIPVSGYYTVQYRVASMYGGNLSLDINAGASKLGEITIPATGGWQNWETISHTVYINAGTHNFGIFASKGGWNLNWFSIKAQTSKTNDTKNSLTNTNTFLEELSIYPNPFTNSIQFNTNLKNTKVIILNALGHKMMTPKINQAENTMDLSHLPKGLYLLTIEKDGIKITKRIVKQ
ncbi:carbohydrate-binding protein [Aquimarina aquimarini]|uniref:carbohydrate-binding protein n=1 Tax=Aquimarina aquimarini TaxID=1191734 RepID=UPI000D54CF1D|nr:carbohydrate-binding protein [Aquimarina aquimarini]